MSIEFSVELTPGHVLVRGTGTYDLASALEMYDAAFAIAEREGLPAALIDALGLEGDLPTAMDRFTMGVHVADLRATGVRLAVVGDLGMIDPEKLGETVAVNRGADVRVFTDLQTARDWVDAADLSPTEA